MTTMNEAQLNSQLQTLFAACSLLDAMDSKRYPLIAAAYKRSAEVARRLLREVIEQSTQQAALRLRQLQQASPAASELMESEYVGYAIENTPEAVVRLTTLMAKLTKKEDHQ